MNKKQIVILVILFANATTSSIYSERKAVAFGLMNVLINVDIISAIKAMEPSLVASYFFIERKNPIKLISKFYKLLDSIYGIPDTLLPDPFGNRLPKPFLDILKGKLSERELIKQLLSIVNNNKTQFYSEREKKIIKNALSITLDTKTLEKILTLNSRGFKALKKYISQGHEVFIFANFSKKAFNVILEKYPQLFSNIPHENIIISSIEKNMKPNNEIYQKLKARLLKKGIQPNKCLCFEAAKELSLTAVNEGFQSLAL